MSANFVHLHNHTEYSLLDGLSKTKKMIARIKEMDMTAAAITDHGVMYGAVEFYKNCQKEGIKPILGMEGYIVPGDLHKKESKVDRANNHIVLLAKDLDGYKNLMKLSSIANVEGYYYRPRMDRETLRKYASGLICLSSCPKGELAEAILSGDMEKAKQVAVWYQEVFGEGNYYLEVQRHQYSDYVQSAPDNKIKETLRTMQKTESTWVGGIVKLSRDLGIPLVATNDSHYINQQDATAQDALVCISTAKNISDTDRMRYVDTPTFYLRSEQEMRAIFPDLPDAITNTLEVAAKTDIQIELGKWYFPHFDLPEGKDAPQVLRETCYELINDSYKQITDELRQRVEFELEVIITKGYAPYFLILADMVNFCTQRGIITNTRGSAAGSVVSFIMGITTVDPIRYYLPFERFLNPYRPSPPDIDLDIADDRREELITYVTEKYGQDKVAQICTFGRMLARGAVRDIARVLGHPYAFGDRISKVIPLGSQGFPMNIDRALDESPEFRSMYDTDAQVKQVVDLAKEIEGNARHASVHAAGTVVSPFDMTDFSPLQLEPKGTKIITQYEMHACEDVGLVKFDILGIRNLSILGAARDIVERERQIKIDLRKLPLDDKKTFTALSHGETMGVFQLGGSGMTKWLKELKPNRIEDIMAMIALFRPGPMANIPEYLARKNGRSKVEYMHPKMSKFLEKSYGILVYQDDLLFTALELAGYDWESVDKFRKAVGKKIPEEMAKQHEIFVKGCQKHSDMSKEEAEKIWELFVPFQGYGFNKAHAASYGIVSYQTGYMKAHYPVEYMTALLTAESGNTDKVVDAIEECKRMKIVVLAPDINSSYTQFTIESNATSLDKRAIRFGLSAIKNVGDAAIDAILAVRKDKPFGSFTDFCLRVDSQKVNRKVLESLIKTGALDRFGKRSSLLAVLDKIREMGSSISKMKNLGQESLFGEIQETDLTDKLPDIDEFEKAQKLEMEKELLGFYLTDHPHADKLAQIGTSVTHRISQLYSEDLGGQTVTIGGIIDHVRVVTTKTNNQQMAFAKISDLGKSVDIVVFPRVYAATSAVWKQDNVVLVQGKLESTDSTSEDEAGIEVASHEVSLLANTAASYIGPDTQLPLINGQNGNGRGNGYSNGNGNGNSFSHFQEAPKKPAPISIYVPQGTAQSKLIALNTLLQSNRGQIPAELIFATSTSSRAVPIPYGLAWSRELKEKVDSLLKGQAVG
jgi:DNA polymerase-3 subunit alpha